MKSAQEILKCKGCRKLNAQVSRRSDDSKDGTGGTVLFITTYNIYIYYYIILYYYIYMYIYIYVYRRYIICTSRHCTFQRSDLTGQLEHKLSAVPVWKWLACTLMWMRPCVRFQKITQDLSVFASRKIIKAGAPRQFRMWVAGLPAQLPVLFSCFSVSCPLPWVCNHARLPQVQKGHIQRPELEQIAKVTGVWLRVVPLDPQRSRPIPLYE